MIGVSYGLLPNLPFIQAKNCGPARHEQRIDVVVIHSMEVKDKPGTARQIAVWFGSPNAPVASAHYCIDSDEVIQCVQENVVAWAAPGANKRGIHVELAGFAKQTSNEWNDEYSAKVLLRARDLVFDICTRHEIPLQKLSSLDLKNGHRGICGHVDVTKAYPELKGTHWDPGPHFPWTDFMTALRLKMRDTLPDRGDDPDA